MKEKIRVLVADDHDGHRRRYERIIEKQEDMVLNASASNGYEAVLQAGIHRPHIILMDVEMEDKTAGISAARQINKTLPDVKIIIVTAHEDENIVYAAFQTGIVDYIIKSEDSTVISDAVRSAHNNLSPIRPIVAEKIRKDYRKTKETEESLLYTLKLISDLSPGELEVLRLLYEGKKRKAIAEERYVSPETVKKQINSILKKCSKPDCRSLVSDLKKLRIFEVLNKLK